MLLSTNNQLSSRFGFSDPVVVYFGTAGIIQNCTVIKIHLTGERVSYDVEIKWKHSGPTGMGIGFDREPELTSRLYNVDSAVVFSPDDFEQ